MFVRRRPLLRAAAIGGTAYVAGKRHAQRSQRQWSGDQSTQASVPQQGGEMGQEPSAPSVSDQLAQLSTLHAQGSLTDAEFAAAKSRLLGQ